MAGLTFTFADLQASVFHALHAQAGSGTTVSVTDAVQVANAKQTVNRALDMLVQMHPWRFRTKNLSIDVVQTAITSLSRTTNVITVTQTAHGYGQGAAVEIIGALDSAFNGQFIVADVLTPDTFILRQLGPDAVATTPGFTIPGALLLPSDFDSLLSLKSATNSYRDVFPTTMDDLWLRRQYIYGNTAYETWFALNWQQQTSVTSAPRAVLEVYPIPQAAGVGQFVGSYLRIIPSLSASTDVPDIPTPYHGLLMTLCRALAVSNEEDRSGSDWDLFGRMVIDAAANDGASQGPIVAQLRNTINRGWRPSPFFPAGRIQTT